MRSDATDITAKKFSSIPMYDISSRNGVSAMNIVQIPWAMMATTGVCQRALTRPAASGNARFFAMA